MVDSREELFSAALCRGLIEALESHVRRSGRNSFSAALCRGLIEARRRAKTSSTASRRFPRLYAAASLKHIRRVNPYTGLQGRFPRLYAAASLKPQVAATGGRRCQTFSAALCRGLIEAGNPPGRRRLRARRFSAALCRGLIEAPAPPASRRTPSSFSAALCRGLIEARDSDAARAC